MNNYQELMRSSQVQAIKDAIKDAIKNAINSYVGYNLAASIVVYLYMI